MTAAIITILASVIPLFVWWIQRKAQQEADPTQQNRNRYETIDKDIAGALRSGSEKDAMAASIHAGADLDELDRLQRSHDPQRRPN